MKKSGRGNHCSPSLTCQLLHSVAARDTTLVVVVPIDETGLVASEDQFRMRTGGDVLLDPAATPKILESEDVDGHLPELQSLLQVLHDFGRVSHVLGDVDDGLPWMRSGIADVPH